MMEMLEGMAGNLAMESGEAMMAAVEFEKALLNIGHTLAGQAIHMDELSQEDERIKTDEWQIKLLGKLLRTTPSDHATCGALISPHVRR